MSLDPERLVAMTTRRQRRLEGINVFRSVAILEQAIDSLVERQSSWRPAELVREVAAAVPTTVTLDAEQLTRLLQQSADHATDNRCVDLSPAVPVGVPLRSDRSPIIGAAVDRVLTTRSILDEEEQLLAWARRRLQPDRIRPLRPVAGEEGLAAGQQAAVAAVAGWRGLELIVGPAGAGKTTMLAAAVRELRSQGRRAFGVTPTAVAAGVLAAEAGLPADTLDKLLTEHHQPTRPPRPGYDLSAGTTVIVDEAGTAATPKLAELARLADQYWWRIVMVGDPRQFSAVGRGGMFAHLVDLHGGVELDQVHRFHHRWERYASLRLRIGDPTALTEYEQQGRLHGGTPQQMENEILTAWQEARQRERRWHLWPTASTPSPGSTTWHRLPASPPAT
jgi:hypothetical protein